MSWRWCAAAGLVVGVGVSAGHAQTARFRAGLSHGGLVRDTFDSFGIANPSSWRFYELRVNAGDVVSVEVNRDDQLTDPALGVYRGSVAGLVPTTEFTALFASGATLPLVAFGDDEIPNDGPNGDPRVQFTATVTGVYTVAVANRTASSFGTCVVTAEGSSTPYFKFQATSGGGATFTVTDEPGRLIEDATIGGQTDAFDGAGGMRFNGAALTGGVFLQRVLPEGLFIAMPAEEIDGGFSVVRELLVFSHRPAVRVRLRISNNASATGEYGLVIESNSGADAGMVVAGTASGDAIIDAEDRWVGARRWFVGRW